MSDYNKMLKTMHNEWLIESLKTFGCRDEFIQMHKATVEEISKRLANIENKDSNNEDGYWLPYAEDKDSNGKMRTVEWVCGKCRRVASVTRIKTPFCPICGKRMRDVELMS